MNSFSCKNCNEDISTEGFIGTCNRNHCPHCLYSLHVDKTPGDRLEKCRSLMEPIGLTFKEEGFDKYGNKKQGELMIIHKCKKCGKININRIAADDGTDKIMKLYERSLLTNVKNKDDLKKERITLLREEDLDSIKEQLFGRKL